jgi:hypothetical protein
VDAYLPEKAWQGMTVLADNHDLSHPRILEVNMEGEITWEYDLPADLRAYTNPGLDVEPLPNGNTLITGADRIIEVTPEKEIAWELRLPGVVFSSPQEAPARGFYKAVRV